MSESKMMYRPLAELRKLENNPRTIRDDQFETLCRSIKNNPEYFAARPLILSNRTGALVILAGNQRYEAAKELRLKQVPTYLIEGLTEEKELEIVIRDNVNNGEWDEQLLATEWDKDLLSEWGLELVAIGGSNEKKETVPVGKGPMVCTCPNCGHEWEKTT